MERPELKIRKFTNPAKAYITERYVIENKEDLEKTLESFPQLANNLMGVAEVWRKALSEEKIILVTDESWIGYPTYCLESKIDSTHPDSLIRINDEEV